MEFAVYVALALGCDSRRTKFGEISSGNCDGLVNANPITSLRNPPPNAIRVSQCI